MNKILILLLSLIFLLGMTIPAISQPPVPPLKHPALEYIDSKCPPWGIGTVTITHQETGKIMATIEYQDTDGSGNFTQGDDVLSFENIAGITIPPWVE